MITFTLNFTNDGFIDDKYAHLFPERFKIKSNLCPSVGDIFCFSDILNKNEFTEKEWEYLENKNFELEVISRSLSKNYSGALNHEVITCVDLYLDNAYKSEQGEKRRYYKYIKENFFIVLAEMIMSLFIPSYTVLSLYKWFFSQKYSLPEITIFESLIIVGVIQLVISSNSKRLIKLDSIEKYNELIIEKSIYIFNWLAVLLIGYIIHVML